MRAINNICPYKTGNPSQPFINTAGKYCLSPVIYLRGRLHALLNCSAYEGRIIKLSLFSALQSLQFWKEVPLLNVFYWLNAPRCMQLIVVLLF